MRTLASTRGEHRQATGSSARPAVRPVWIYRPRTDLVISLCWLPLFLAGRWLSAGTGVAADSRLRWAVATILLISFLHQPLTLALVYGDRHQFEQRRRLFLWAPPVTVAVVVTAVVLHLWIVVPIAGLWNTVHTLQQRYGLSRIYARRARYGSAALDRWVLYAWMAAAALVVAANPATAALVRRVSLDSVNAGGVQLLTDIRPIALVLLVPVGLLAAGLAIAIAVQEVRTLAGPRHRDNGTPNRGKDTAAGGKPVAGNPAKWLYQASSLLLIASIAVDPVAGFIAYVGAHAIEYGVVVYKTTEARYGGREDRSTLLGRVAGSPGGRLAVMGGVAGGALAVAGQFHGETANVILFSVGALHFLYDGFIWKLRKPAVAADFAIPSS